MIPLMQSLSPILATAIIAAMAWFLRTQGASKADIRTHQLALAKECLDKHAAALEQILEDPHAPIELKRLTITVSDALSDRTIVAKLAEWGVARPADQPMDTEETRAIDAILVPLRISHPDLVESFGSLVVTAVAGASLRWPESAVLFAQVFPRLMTTPKRDVAIAATATSLWPNGPFSLKPTVPALA